MMRPSRILPFLSACLLIAKATPVQAFELSGGVSAGAFLAGTEPRFAVSPHAGISWRLEGTVLVAARDLFSILPATNGDGVGIYNQTALAVGYATEKADASIGPS